MPGIQDVHIAIKIADRDRRDSGSRS